MGDVASDADKSDEDNDDPFNAPSPKKSKPSTSVTSDSVTISDSQGIPMFDPNEIHHPHSTEWFPAEPVGEYVASRLRTSLDKQTRAKLRSECPCPFLHSKSSSTPTIDPSLLAFFTKLGNDPRKGVNKAWSTCQDKRLDVVVPLTRIFNLAESARLQGAPKPPSLTHPKIGTIEAGGAAPRWDRATVEEAFLPRRDPAPRPPRRPREAALSSGSERRWEDTSLSSQAGTTPTPLPG
ncbi:hypothetical protein NDU88_005623 [Pleurodeles waltl]|uniref:Uncharacterized protein n=1 Tax=Pleurodeles waltl TaxID=8319 RepID=A0AAV7LNA8_PLEWA|nr:hypothetical protein NDU88_005623 [Pleurodeles waltl]